jgi:zinc protease
MLHTTMNSLRIGSLILLCSFAALGQKPDRTAPPTIGPPPSFTMAPVKHFALSNGLQVVLLEKHQVPLVQINMVIKSGAVNDPAGKAGLASLVADMLTDGAGTRDALAFADAIDYLGASLDGASGYHTSSVSLHTPVSKLDSALALQADALLRPAFASAELERRRKERLTSLLSWRDQAGAQASYLFSRTLYTTDHPYGRNAIGDEKAIRSISVEDVRQFHKTHYCASNAFLVVAGDVSLSLLQPKLEAAFGAWQNGTMTQPTLPAIEQVQKRTVSLVDKPGAPQTEIRIGCIGAPRMTEDFYPLIVMNSLLGGSFSCRLNQNLREEHGYTYGAGSVFGFRKLAGPFTAYAAVHTAKTDSALIEFMKEFKGILAPIPETEVDRAKNYVALGFPADFQTVGEIASKLEDMAIYGLPDDYYNNYIKNVLAVTKKDVERVAHKYLNPEKMAVILVGDRKEIEAKVAALKLGPLTNLTVEELLGKAPKVE